MYKLGFFSLNHVNSLFILPHYNDIWQNITINSDFSIP